MVTLVEQHVIKAGGPCYEEIDAAAFAAKNLYNLGNYTIRQSWLSGDGYIPYARLYHLHKETEAYQALPRKVSQLVLKQLALSSLTAGEVEESDDMEELTL